MSVLPRCSTETVRVSGSLGPFGLSPVLSSAFLPDSNSDDSSDVFSCEERLVFTLTPPEIGGNLSPRTPEENTSEKMDVSKMASALRVVNKLKGLVKDAKAKARKRYLQNKKRKFKRIAFLLLLISLVVTMCVTICANITYTVSMPVVGGKYEVYNTLAEMYAFGPGFHLFNIMFTDEFLEYGAVKLPIIMFLGLIIYYLGIGRSGANPDFSTGSKITGAFWLFLVVYNVFYMYTWSDRIEQFRADELKGDLTCVKRMEELGRDAVWFFNLERASAKMGAWSMFLTWDTHLILLVALVQLYAHRVIEALEKTIAKKEKEYDEKRTAKNQQRNTFLENFKKTIASGRGKKCLRPQKVAKFEENKEVKISIDIPESPKQESKEVSSKEVTEETEPFFVGESILDPSRRFSSSSGYDVVIDVESPEHDIENPASL